MAMTWTVPMWFCTLRRLAKRSSQKLGRSSVTRGRMVAKYGALRANSFENSARPNGQRVQPS